MCGSTLYSPNPLFATMNIPRSNSGSILENAFSSSFRTFEQAKIVSMSNNKRRRHSTSELDENNGHSSSSSASLKLKKRKIQHIMSALPKSLSPTTVTDAAATNDCSPHQALLDLFSSQDKEAKVHPSLEVQNFFIQHTQEQIDSYDFDVIQAVRNQEIDTLRDMHKAGRPLQCANRFGESLIHMACRRGFVDVVYFLVNEANVSVKVRDDYGRTVLHDACWTVEPNEELVEFLIEQCPELLLMSDKRGNAPFEYVRSEHWARWVQFVQNKNCFKA